MEEGKMCVPAWLPRQIQHDLSRPTEWKGQAGLGLSEPRTGSQAHNWHIRNYFVLQATCILSAIHC